MDIDAIKAGVREHPYPVIGLAIGIATFGVTGELWMAAFVAILIAVAPELTDAFDDPDDEDDGYFELGDLDE